MIIAPKYYYFLLFFFFFLHVHIKEGGEGTQSSDLHFMRHDSQPTKLPIVDFFFFFCS
jgi:hypothetical protein